MPKPKIPESGVVLGRPGAVARFELAAQIDSILASTKLRLAFLGAFAFLALGLLVAGAQNSHQVNTQGIAYILLAKHYAGGDFGLAVSSYWSPLLSWLLALGLKAGWSDLAAARIVMGLSGALFWLGAALLLFVYRLPAASFLIGVWLAAFAAVVWSVEYIGPDLLGAALLLLAVSGSLAALRFRSRKGAITAGVFWGLVYYAYAPLLSAVVVSLIGFALVAGWQKAKEARRWIAWQAVVAVAVALPWWVVLSLHYGSPTIGSVWAIDRAVAGVEATDAERYHPCFGQLNAPAEGRLSNWEDPARLKYVFWSPFASATDWSRQWNLLKANLRSIFGIFLGFGALGVGLLALATCFVFRRPLDRSLFSESWRWTVFPVGGLALAFLPLEVRELDSRYFYGAYPLLLAAAFGFLQWLPKQFARRQFSKGLLVAIVAVLFGLPMTPRLAATLEGQPHPGGSVALELAERMRSANIGGTIAGDAMLMGSRTGLYVACLLNEPWFGGSPDAVGIDYLASRAEIVIVRRQHRVSAEMELNPAFRNLDAALFPEQEQDGVLENVESAELFPLRVYQVKR